MSVLTLRIDGHTVAVPEGATLLEACRAAGVHLPVLCHLDGLTPVAACRLCLVEVEGGGRLLPACATAAVEGLVVRSDTAELREVRRMAVELFFAEGNHVCAFCVANGSCELQDVAVQVGMDHSRFPYQYPQRSVDASHPLFSLDHNRCILCTRCLRVCDEIEAAHVWDVATAARTARSSPDWINPGARWTPAPPVASAWRSAPPARCSTRRRRPPKNTPIANGPPCCAPLGNGGNGTTNDELGPALPPPAPALRHGVAGGLLRLPHVVSGSR